MSYRFNSAGFVCAGLLLCGAVMPASAQSLKAERALLELPVDERVPQDYRYQGITFRSFVIAPSLDVETRYDSNILADDTYKKSDLSVTVTPGLVIKKHYDGHKFLAGANASISRFADQSSENTEDYAAFLNGELDVNSRMSLPFSMRYQHRVRERNLPQKTLLSEEPLDIDSFYAEGGVTRKFNRLSLSLLGTYKDVRFDNGFSYDQTQYLVFDDQDRTETGGVLRARYEFPRGSESTDIEHIAYADLVYKRHDYKRREYTGAAYAGDSGDRDVYGVLSGFETSYKGLLFANLGAGYLRHDYDQASLDDTGILNVTADVAYNLTPKLTLNAGAKRYISQDNGFVQGVVTGDYTLGADYELLHNLYAGVNAGYSNYDFEDVAGREDKDYSAGADLRYLLSPRLEGGLEYRYQDRTSTDALREFDRHIILMNLKGRL